MEDSFEKENLDDFIIKDKKYRRKKRIKLILIIFTILVIIGIIVVIGIIISEIIKEKAKYKGGQIICSYLTSEDNEKILLININDDTKYDLIIGGINYGKNNYHTFEKSGLHNVIFHFKNKLDSLEGLFQNINNLIEVDFSKLETENIKSMANLCHSCSNLIKINFDNKTPNLENTRSMLTNCYSLNETNLKFDTSKVTQMNEMFSGCKQLVYLDLTNFYLENIINTEYMFEDCYKLKEIKFNNDTKTNNLKKMNTMFQNCHSLEYIDTKIFKVDKLESFSYVFEECHSLKEIDLSHFNTKNINSYQRTFLNCARLEYIDISNFDLSQTKDIRMESTFYGCINLKSIKFSNIKTEELVAINNIFYNCHSLISLDLSSVNFNSILLAESTFFNCTALEYISLPNNMTSLRKTVGMFENCYNLKSINLEFLKNANHLINTNEMFKNCVNLTEIEFPEIETHELLFANEMFSGCISLTSINLEKLKIDNLKYITKMFYNCINLEYLNIYHLNTTKIVNADNIFGGIPTSRAIKLKIDKNITGNILMEAICSLDFILINE